jgi:hypothetical protein
VVGIESCRRGFVDVGASGEILAGYRHALTEGDQADAGDIDLRIPKLRKGSFFPLILEPAGVSTRRCAPW